MELWEYGKLLFKEANDLDKCAENLLTVLEVKLGHNLKLENVL